MGKLVFCVSDIDETTIARDLEQIAYAYGLMDMRQVFLVVEPYMPYTARIPSLFIDQDNAFDSLRVLIGLAVINYALSVYKDLEIATTEPGKVICLQRRAKVSTHRRMTDWCLIQIREMIKRS